MKINTGSGLYFKYCPDKINGDFIQTWGDMFTELSVGHAKQLSIYLQKILDGKLPKLLKFRKHALCSPPHVEYDQEFDGVIFADYSNEIFLNRNKMKKLVKWLDKQL